MISSLVLPVELHYMPSISAFTRLMSSPRIDVQLWAPYSKMSFRNRCIISGSQGKQSLSVPILGGRGIRGSYGSVDIDARIPWNLHHWRAIFSAYGRSPWFECVAPALERLYLSPSLRLADWNLRCLDVICSAVGLTLPVVIAPGREAGDCPSTEPGVSSPWPRPSDYHSADPGSFPIYLQVFQEKTGFLPNLSVLDVVCCAGPRFVRDWVLLHTEKKSSA